MGDRVAILARNSHAFAAVRFAVARLGAVLVPINFMLNAEEARFILEHSGAQLLCVDSGLAALGREASKGTAVKAMVWLPGEHEGAAEPGLLNFDALLPGRRLRRAQRPASMLPQIIYTSGTESRPKGAMLTHGAVIAEYVTCLVDAEIAEDDRALHALPLYHCAQLDVFFGPGIYVGATTSSPPGPTPDNLLALMAANGSTRSSPRPRSGSGCCARRRSTRPTCRGWRRATTARRSCRSRCSRRSSSALPQVRLWNLYGQTEIAPVATVLKPEDQLRKAGSAGRPALNVETRVVDDAMNDVPSGEVGEIVHRSPQLLSGYYNDAERTRAAFDGGWFHSGDLATIDDEGYITVVDRKKDMIKSGGENVASREVEEAIYAIDGVSEVAVIGLPDPRWIEAVTAVVVAKAGPTLTEEGLIAACREPPGRVQGAQARDPRRRAAEEPERQAAQARTAAALRLNCAGVSRPGRAGVPRRRGARP